MANSDSLTDKYSLVYSFQLFLKNISSNLLTLNIFLYLKYWKQVINDTALMELKVQCITAVLSR